MQPGMSAAKGAELRGIEDMEYYRQYGVTLRAKGASAGGPAAAAAQPRRGAGLRHWHWRGAGLRHFRPEFPSRALQGSSTRVSRRLGAGTEGRRGTWLRGRPRQKTVERSPLGCVSSVFKIRSSASNSLATWPSHPS